ncbi:hypothetical protein [Cellulophaga sp. Ld12]|uniref:hypothetical protein n=1 Tax=Cellulophaga sp. Ld12 TaxID=3229535 RepID=UPI003865CD3B
MKITENTIGANISKFLEKKFTILDIQDCAGYGVHPRFNFLIENSHEKFSFLEFEIKKFAFRNDEGIIKDIILFIDVLDIDEFYEQMVFYYGTAELARLSSIYLKKNGFLKPIDVKDSDLGTHYDGVPTPSVLDYKYLHGLSWFDLKTKLDTSIEINMYVLNARRYEDRQEVQVTFRGMIKE